MRIAVTGAYGFMGWHVRAALVAHARHEVVPIGREEYASASVLAEALTDCDAVIHLAGLNRGPEAEVEAGNRYLAETLAAALIGSRVRVVIFGNSIHAGSDSAFGRSKAYASAHLAGVCEAAGIAFTDVVLPNVFGEGGRPRYNSFVATFCDDLLAGRQPEVIEDRELDLLAAQDAADVLVAAVEAARTTQVRPRGQETSVRTVLELLREMSAYSATGDFPDLSSSFRVALFNTFLSHCFPASFPFGRTTHSDQRGTLFEAARARRTDSLSFVSTTVPGAVRGEHFHRRKIERFVVVDGIAEIRLRRLVSAEEVVFQVSGDQPQAVDMPTMWAHSLKNVGSGNLTTLFWTNELLDPQQPDTFRSPVYGGAGASS